MKASYNRNASDPRINEFSFCGKTDPRAAEYEMKRLAPKKEITCRFTSLDEIFRSIVISKRR